MSAAKSYLTMREFIDLAIEFEESSAELYRRMQAEAKDDTVKELLKKLEADEVEHKRILASFTEYGPEDQRLQFAPEMEKAMPQVPANANYGQLLDSAIDREVKSYELYTWTAGLVKGAFKELLEGLAKFEKVHEVSLKKLK